MPNSWEPAPEGPPDTGVKGKRGRWQMVRLWCEEHRGEWAKLNDVSNSTGTNFRRWGYEVIGHTTKPGRSDVWVRLPKQEATDEG